PNLLKPGPEQVTALEPEQVWVADITYLPLRNGTAYLSLVTDACSRKIMGYHVGENLQTENVVKAFRPSRSKLIPTNTSNSPRRK
ncbi:DDE-type integrase/transposase/recombinase, partial [Escherichia coli]|nr:DDE-type integrase/transposase/recombinase [Escherichia coli]